MQSQYKSQSSNGLKVLLLVEDSNYDRDLQNALITCGYHVFPRLTKVSILKVVDEVAPDVIVLDVDRLSSEDIHSLTIVNQIDPKPIVVFTEFSDEFMINKLINSQINAYVVGDKMPHHVGPTMQVAIARFNQVQSLKKELDETKRRLDGRKWIDKAKGILMEHKGLSEDQAYKTLRKMAMDNSQKIDDVAKNVVSVMQAVS